MDEINRLQEFRQMKENIRGSEKYLVVGIDVAKERHHAFFGRSDGKTLLRALVFDNSKEGFEKLCFHEGQYMGLSLKSCNPDKG
jgi:transposase